MMPYPLAALDLLERARTKHRRSETRARDTHADFLFCLNDWQDSTGDDRASARRCVLDSLETLRVARQQVVDAAMVMGGVHAVVEGVRV